MRKEAERELSRLERLPPAAPDYQVDPLVPRAGARAAVEEDDRRTSSTCRARGQVLDEDHIGLEEVKERILEDLAVLKLNPQAKAPILCLVGPPGVGKTSLGQSIARALGRKFERFSLGGLHDEAELRGHRRTYIGAMPGRLIQAMRRAGVNNPVLMLDEMDKLGRDYPRRPGQRAAGDPRPGAERHVPRQLPRPAVRPVEGVLHHDGQHPRHDPAAAAGPHGGPAPVGLQRGGEGADRHALPDAAAAGPGRAERRASCSSTPEALRHDHLPLHPRGGRARAGADHRPGRPQGRPAVRRGPRRARSSSGRTSWPTCWGRSASVRSGRAGELPAGVATGLAWTEAGGDVLYVEATLLPGEHGLRLTGQLGKVMKESARAARSFIASHAESWASTAQDPRSTASTSTSRPARCRRTARRRAWRW